MLTNMLISNTPKKISVEKSVYPFVPQIILEGRWPRAQHQESGAQQRKGNSNESLWKSPSRMPSAKAEEMDRLLHALAIAIEQTKLKS